jgi:Domain of unknown function (DUF4338)
MKHNLYLQFCSSSDVVDFEARHYVVKMPKDALRATPASKAAGKPRGHHGQQIHFLIWYNGENVGAISGGSAVYATACRDNFFDINSNNREQVINGIIDNTLFRLENPERNLASRCLSLWRKKIVGYWKYLYDVEPFGFETFVEYAELQDGTGRQRVGSLYLADNWNFVGETFGSTKNHIGVGLTGGLQGKVFERTKAPIKRVFCKWISGFSEPVYCEYKSSWRGKTEEEKLLAKNRAERRKKCMGTTDVKEVS